MKKIDVKAMKKKVMESMLATFLDNDYERVYIIDIAERKCCDIYDLRFTEDYEEVPWHDYDAVLFKTLRGIRADMSSAELRQKFSLDNVEKELESRTAYSIYYSFNGRGDRHMHRRATFYRIEGISDFVCYSVQDLTDYVENEQSEQRKLQAALLDEKQASFAQRSLLSRLSRDVRTPINSIIGLAEIAHSELGNPEVLERYLKEIATSGEYISGILEDIINLYQIENNEIVLQPEKVNMRKFLSEIENEHRPKALENGQHFTVKRERLASTVVLADRYRLTQIIRNLLANAFYNLPAGGSVIMNVAELDRQGDSTTLSVSVQSDGGIDPERLEAIFDAEASRSSRELAVNDKVGLGLIIARSYIVAMDGEIRAENWQGQDTKITFRVKLPIPFEQRENYAKQTRVSSETPVMNGRRILLVDDHKLSLEIGNKILEKTGAEVVTARNGKEALDIFADDSESFDMIFMDIRMPVMDGLTATRAIRELDLPGAADVPIVAMTASAFEDDIRESFSAGMNAHLAKPFGPRELYQVMERFLKGAGR